MRRAWRAWAPVAFSVLVGAVLYQELAWDFDATGYGDYQEYHHLWESAWIAITRHGEWPLWNPHQCGGITQYGNPQTQVFHPLFYASLLIGPTIALKLFLFVHVVLGVYGAYLLARREQRLSEVASWLAAIGWAGSGYFAYHCGTGHANFIAFYLTPWLVVGWRWAMRDVRWALLVGLVMAFTVLAGGVYAFPFYVFLVGHEVVWSWRLEARRPRVLAAGALSVLVTVLVGAIRLVPILTDLQHHPRDQRSIDWMDPSLLLEALTSQRLVWPMPEMPDHPWLWVEYSQYVGWPILGLALIGAAVAVQRTGARWLLTGTIGFGLLTMGNFADWAPWTLVHELPIYDSLKVPSRFGVLMLLHLTLLAGLGLDWLGKRVGAVFKDRRAGARAGLGFALLVGLIGVADVTHMHRAVLEGKWRDPRIRRVEPLQYFVVHRPERLWASGEDIDPVPAWYPQINVGSGFCYSGMRYHGAFGLWEGREPQVRIEPRGGVLLDEGQTSSTVWAVVEVTQPSLLTFNRTWAPGWESNLGEVRMEDQERMQIVAPPGHHRVVLEYRPPTLVPALVITVIGVFVCLIIARMRPEYAAHPIALVLYAAGVIATLSVYWDAMQIEPPAILVEPRMHATASGYAESELNPWYQPQNVTDGRPGTEWHLPDGELGWLDLRFDEPRNVAYVRLLNARNDPHHDRAARRIALTAYREDEIVAATGPVWLPVRWDGEWNWSSLELEAPGVDRLRVEVLEHHGVSGGLAEVQVHDMPVAFDAIADLRASSTAVWSTPYEARDRRMDTRWAPTEDDQEPWLDLLLSQRTDVTGVVLRRAPDVAPGCRVRVQAYWRDELVNTVEATLVERHYRTAIPLRVRGVDRVRLLFDAPWAATVHEVSLY